MNRLFFTWRYRRSNKLQTPGLSTTDEIGFLLPSKETHSQVVICSRRLKISILYLLLILLLIQIHSAQLTISQQFGELGYPWQGHLEHLFNSILFACEACCTILLQFVLALCSSISGLSWTPFSYLSNSLLKCSCLLSCYIPYLTWYGIEESSFQQDYYILWNFCFSLSIFFLYLLLFCLALSFISNHRHLNSRTVDSYGQAFSPKAQI